MWSKSKLYKIRCACCATAVPFSQFFFMLYLCSCIRFFKYCCVCITSVFSQFKQYILHNRVYHQLIILWFNLVKHLFIRCCLVFLLCFSCILCGLAVFIIFVLGIYVSGTNIIYFIVFFIFVVLINWIVYVVYSSFYNWFGKRFWYSCSLIIYFKFSSNFLFYT